MVTVYYMRSFLFTKYTFRVANTRKGLHQFRLSQTHLTPSELSWSSESKMSKEDVKQWFEKPELTALNIPASSRERWVEEISQRYGEKQRRYHTLQHLADMMGHYHRWRGNLSDQAAVLLAILFHDIIYDPKSATNEEDSVQLFQDFANDVHLDDEISAFVRRLIVATIKHLPDDASYGHSDLRYFLDFDMAILGQNDKDYDLYAEQIRKEYSHYKDEDFCKGRSKVLQTFLERPRIYFTEEVKEALEHQARNNMKREIESLQNKLFVEGT